MKRQNPDNLRASTPDTSRVNRRQFLRYTAGATAALATTTTAAIAKKPKPPKPGLPAMFDHVVVVMMENRSFDHFFGWVPEADGRQSGLVYPDRTGAPRMTYPLAPDYQGCGHPDLDHSYEGGRVAFNNGACDGWLRAGMNDEYAIGYYTQADLPFYAGAIPTWGTFDRYFSAIMAGTWPNKIYQWAAQTDRLTNSLGICTLPTIFDLLAQRGLQGRYYFSDVPFSALWGAKYLPITRHITEFFANCAAGTLPNVSYVDPRFLGESLGLTNDDHPHADIRNGQAFLNSIYEAVTRSPAWARTVFVINYDEWGGFFDHVPPARAPIPPADHALGSDGLRGFRVPAMVISPFARRGKINHQVFDHTSVLKMIESRWQLPALTVRDASANNLGSTLDFDRPNLTAPQHTVPSGFFGTPCLDGLPVGGKWESLGEIALGYGHQLFV